MTVRRGATAHKDLEAPMRALRLIGSLSVAFLLVSCEPQPTALDESPQLVKASDDNMLVPWFLYEDPGTEYPCANGGAGVLLSWTGEIGGFGTEHLTPSGNYQRVLTVEFRNVEFRDMSGTLYPFVKVEQTEVTQVKSDGQTNYHFTDNEFYLSPDGRRLRVQWFYHIVLGADGTPSVERLMLSCSPAKW
jgi:hypothetical protein